MILVDSMQICLANIAMATKVYGDEISEDYVRHMILNSLRKYNKEHKEEYGEMVLCYDGSKNWRKSIYPEYKAHRRRIRSESDIDWDLLFTWIYTIRDEIKNNFPYRVIHVAEAEADDIIAVLAREADPFENHLIVSSDKDFIQLHDFTGCKQYDPIRKRWLTGDSAESLINKIFYGDKGDGVPNILSDNLVFVEGRRQTPLQKKKYESWKGFEDPTVVIPREFIGNYERNKTMVDLNEQPKDVVEQILAQYDEGVKGRNDKIFGYLINKRLAQLQESVQDFFAN
jgi:hypothetical protein